MQKESIRFGKTLGAALPKALKAAFMSDFAHKWWNRAGYATAGILVGREVLNDDLFPPIKERGTEVIEDLAESATPGFQHLDTIINTSKNVVRDAKLEEDLVTAKNKVLDNLAEGTQQALVASLAAGGGAAGGYGLATLLSENPNYRMPAALLGAAIGGTAGMLYPKLIKSSNSQLTGAHNMLNTDNTAAGFYKDAGIKDWAKGALSFLKRIRTPKTTAVGRFTGNIKPWTQKATSKFPTGTGLAVGGAITTGAIGRNMINNYYDAQAAAELQRQRDMDVHRAALISTQARNAAQQALAKSNNPAGSPAAPVQPNWAGLGIGAGAGGLAGYGVGAALSKDKLVRLLTALGGGALGGYVGNQLANQNAKQASLELPIRQAMLQKTALDLDMGDKATGDGLKRPATANVPPDLSPSLEELVERQTESVNRLRAQLEELNTREISDAVFQKRIAEQKANQALAEVKRITDAYNDVDKVLARNAREQEQLYRRIHQQDDVNHMLSVGLGAGVGGLAGYGIGAAFTDKPVYRALAALAGAGAGGFGTDYLMSATEKQASLAMPTTERIMCKIASRDGSGLCTLTSIAAMRKTAAGEQAPTVWDAIREWATADNYKNLKRVGTGLGVGLGTYALSGLLPGASKNRGARALLAGAAGLGAGLYGDKLVNGIQAYFNRSNVQQNKQKQDQWTQQQAQTQAGTIKIPTYRDYVNKWIAGPQLFQTAQPLDKPFTPKPQYGPLRQPQVNLPTYQDFVRRMLSGPQLWPTQGISQQPKYGPRVR